MRGSKKPGTPCMSTLPAAIWLTQACSVSTSGTPVHGSPTMPSLAVLTSSQNSRSRATRMSSIFTAMRRSLSSSSTASSTSFATTTRGETEILEQLGVRVIRFSNDEICADLDSVLARIRAELRLPFD